MYQTHALLGRPEGTRREESLDSTLSPRSQGIPNPLKSRTDLIEALGSKQGKELMVQNPLIGIIYLRAQKRDG